jgi:hypothetical protein
LPQTSAVDRVEHPTRKGQLESSGDFDGKDFFSTPPPNTDHFHLSSVKRMVLVMDVPQRGLMSSMSRRYSGHLVANR